MVKRSVSKGIVPRSLAPPPKVDAAGAPPASGKGVHQQKRRDAFMALKVSGVKRVRKAAVPAKGAAAAAGGPKGKHAAAKGAGGAAAGAPLASVARTSARASTSAPDGGSAEDFSTVPPPAALGGGAAAAGAADAPVKKKKWHPKKWPKVPPAEGAAGAPVAPAAAAAPAAAKAAGAALKLAAKAPVDKTKRYRKAGKTPAEAAAAAAATSIELPGFGGPVGSNWNVLKKAINADGTGKARIAASMELEAAAEGAAAGGGALKRPCAVGTDTGLTQIVALDCEMVGVGPDGKRSALARVCLVNNDGHILLDTFVRTTETVTDYRTQFSGVRPADLSGPDAITPLEAQVRVTETLKNRTLVGHALHNDLKALMMSHPRKDVRDTAKYPPLMRSTAPGRPARPRALRHLASEVLGLTIQSGEHSPVDDARCALYLYHKHKREWEQAVKSGKLGREPKAGAKVVKRVKKKVVDIFKRDIKDDPMADL